LIDHVFRFKYEGMCCLVSTFLVKLSSLYRAVMSQTEIIVREKQTMSFFSHKLNSSVVYDPPISQFGYAC
uniref:Uncharacterized protein n=1 Tax=Amphimedon queenslandica TaxID=400682 RepID=A0A1X7UCG5_AMPQE